MSVDAIVRTIETEAELEADRIVAEAGERGASLVAEAEAAAQARIRIARERAEPIHRAEAMRLVNAARLRLLERRAEEAASSVDAVFREAGARLAVIAADPACERWHRALESLLEETVALAGPGSLVGVRTADLPAARSVAERLGCRLEENPELDRTAGVVARSADGRIEVDATAAARLTRARASLAEAVGRILGLGS